MVELDSLNIHSSREIIARHGLTLPELFELSLEFYKEGSLFYVNFFVFHLDINYRNLAFSNVRISTGSDIILSSYLLFHGI